MAYGPFAPNAGRPAVRLAGTDGAATSPKSATSGANLVRVYHVPAKWFLDLAAEHKLKVLIDIPWNKHLCFLDSRAQRAEAREAVRRAVFACARHPAVFAFSVANEIPPDIVRWSGAQAVADFIDDLVQEAKRADPECLCTFTNYPPTEFLRPQSVDFVCFNVYLHQRAAVPELPGAPADAGRVQTAAAGGIRHGFAARGRRPRKAKCWSGRSRSAFRGGLAGAVVFSFTDDWWRGGRQIEDWRMGLTTRDRQPKAAFRAVQKMFRAAPYFPLRALSEGLGGGRQLQRRAHAQGLPGFAAAAQLPGLRSDPGGRRLDGRDAADRLCASQCPLLPPREEPGPLGRAQHAASPRRRARSSPSRTPTAGPTRTGCTTWWASLLQQRIRGHRRPQPAAAGGFAGGGGGDGFARADRPT